VDGREDVGGGGAVEAGGWFVDEQHVGGCGEGAGDAQAALFTAGEVRPPTPILVLGSSPRSIMLASRSAMSPSLAVGSARRMLSATVAVKR
jgi:hypothetical protein